MRSSIFYDREGNPVDDVLEWASIFDSDRVVVQSIHKGRRGEVWISTVFTGFDQGHGLSSGPLLFESMVFERRPAEWNAVHGYRGGGVACVRYPTEEAARRGHDELRLAFG